MELSNKARAMLAIQWGDSEEDICFGTGEFEPHPETKAAFDELIDAGIIQTSIEKDGAIRLSLTAKGKDTDRRAPGKTAMQRFRFIEEHGKFPMAGRRVKKS